MTHPATTPIATQPGRLAVGARPAARDRLAHPRVGRWGQSWSGGATCTVLLAGGTA